MESQSTAGTTLPDVAARFTQWPHLLIWKQGFLRGSFGMDVYYFTPNTSFICFFFRRKIGGQGRGKRGSSPVQLGRGSSLTLTGEVFQALSEPVL